MKKVLLLLAFLVSLTTVNSYGQEINLGPNPPIQVKGVLQQLYGGTGTDVTTPSCYGTGHALQWNPSLSTPQYQCYTFSLFTGTVTSVTSPGTNPMFTVVITNPTTTPSIAFTISNAVNQIFVGTGAGTGNWATLPSCSGASNALLYNNSTQTFSCNTISGSTTNAVTFAASGGASPGASFNGSTAVTVDYSTVGAPSDTGAGASGTWGINISGNANTATSATTAGSANSVANGITFNNGGSGASSGTVYNGSTAYTISYNTVGAPSATGAGASGTWGISISGNAISANTASTATALAATPSQCSSGFATGIAANGNANCSSFTPLTAACIAYSSTTSAGCTIQADGKIKEWVTGAIANLTGCDVGNPSSAPSPYSGLCSEPYITLAWPVTFANACLDPNVIDNNSVVDPTNGSTGQTFASGSWMIIGTPSTTGIQVQRTFAYSDAGTRALLSSYDGFPRAECVGN